MYNKVDKFKEIVDEMLDLYQRKQSDYGDSVGKTFDEYGLVSFLVRIEDKLNRVATLTKKSTTEQQVKDEKIEDIKAQAQYGRNVKRIKIPSDIYQTSEKDEWIRCKQAAHKVLIQQCTILGINNDIYQINDT